MDYIYGINYQEVILTLVIGIVISMFLYEKYNALTGGIIVAPVLSLFLYKPIFVASTLLMVVILHLMVNVIRKRTILYGRRLYVSILFIGISLSLLTGLVARFIHLFGYGLFLYDGTGIFKLPFVNVSISDTIIDLGFGAHYYGYVIGLLMVPIVVNDAQNQGLTKTLKLLLFVMTSTFIIIGGYRLIVAH
ncbi:MAG: hypothetical protein OIN86_10820 [Candidatus Methanoperedens sp.]|nr:hypothetical protein [Candidatus Methanoperedens sp.]CAG0964366.1 hypothetical protein METP1_00888 [Methanosarcinales archaeon]